MENFHRKIIYQGSFDPITLGHEDIIKRMSRTFPQSECHIVIANNREKKHMFDISIRTKLVRDFLEVNNLKNVIAVPYEGIMSNYINDNNIDLVIRGLRDGIDLDYEKKIEIFTQETTNAETVYFSTQPEHSGVSSSQVRNFIKFGFKDKIGSLVSEKTKDTILQFRGF
jgi:pantetheine-phosphate adenylyltransferase